MLLAKNQDELDKIVASVTREGINDALLKLLNDKADTLQKERNRLKAEQRQLTQQLVPLAHAL